VNNKDKSPNHAEIAVWQLLQPQSRPALIYCTMKVRKLKKDKRVELIAT